MRRIVLWISLATLGASGCGSGEPGPSSAAGCEEALEAEVALRVPAAMPADQRDQHAAAIRASEREAYLSRCQTWSRAQIECVTGARTSAEARACAEDHR